MPLTIKSRIQTVHRLLVTVPEEAVKYVVGNRGLTRAFRTRINAALAENIGAGYRAGQLWADFILLLDARRAQRAALKVVRDFTMAAQQNGGNT